MALFWAVNVGGEENWHFADRIMDYFDTSRIVQADEWWEDLGKAGDIEGHIVHYWLLNHGYLIKSNLGNAKEIHRMIKSK